MRGRKRARQQEPTVKMPRPSFQLSILGIIDTWRLRGCLAEQEQVAAFNFLGADRAEPFAPVRRQIETAIRKSPMVWCHPLKRNGIVEAHGQGDQRVLLAVTDPGR